MTTTTARGYGYRDHQVHRDRLLRIHRDGTPCPAVINGETCGKPMYRDKTRNYDGMALEADHEDQLQDQDSRRGHRPSRLVHGRCNRRLGRARQLERQAAAKSTRDPYGLPTGVQPLI